MASIGHGTGRVACGRWRRLQCEAGVEWRRLGVGGGGDWEEDEPLQGTGRNRAVRL